MMLINAKDTQIDACHLHEKNGGAKAQQELIFAIMDESTTKDWSIGEMAEYTGIDKSTVSARMFELREKLKKIQWAPKRKDKVSGVTITPMELVQVQRSLFQ